MRRAKNSVQSWPRFGKYKNTHLPMSLKFYPDIAQTIMENVLSGIIVVDDMFSDDAGVFSSSWDHHTDLLSTILHHLNDNHFISHPLTCEWLSKKWTGFVLGSFPIIFSNEKNQWNPAHGLPTYFIWPLPIHRPCQLLPWHVAKPPSHTHKCSQTIQQ